jgi:acyl-CoA synthetase (AMP-forming)/AMP-acid ligase II
MSDGENLGRKNLGRETLDALQAFGSQTSAPGVQMLSAAEMMAAAGDLAASLRAGACAPDEPIALFIANEPLDLAGFLGIWLAGCVAAPIHVATPAMAAQALVGRLGSRLAIRAGRLVGRSRASASEAASRGGGADRLYVRQYRAAERSRARPPRTVLEAR